MYSSRFGYGISIPALANFTIDFSVISSAMRRRLRASWIHTRSCRFTSEGPKPRTMTIGAGSSLTPFTSWAASFSSTFARSMSDS